MDAPQYNEDLDVLGQTLGERLRAARINLVFMDRGWLAVWHSSSTYHQKVKRHTPPLLVETATTIDELANKAFAHLNSLYAGYNGLLLKEDLQAYMAINHLSQYGHKDGQDILYVMHFQITAIHVSEISRIGTNLRDPEQEQNNDS